MAYAARSELQERENTCNNALRIAVKNKCIFGLISSAFVLHQFLFAFPLSTESPKLFARIQMKKEAAMTHIMKQMFFIALCP